MYWYIKYSCNPIASTQSFCRLRILITDVNEFAPVFSSLTYYGRVTLKGSESFLGSDDTEEFVILAVQASDADRGRNAMISYSISKGTRLVCKPVMSALL